MQTNSVSDQHKEQQKIIAAFSNPVLSTPEIQKSWTSLQSREQCEIMKAVIAIQGVQIKQLRTTEQFQAEEIALDKKQLALMRDYEKFMQQHQSDVSDRIANAQERQAAALEEQNFQQQINAIEQSMQQSELQQKLDAIDFDLQMNH